MFTNKLLDTLITITAFITFPLQLVSTLILGILVRLTFGLLLLLFSFIWMVVFLYPLIGISFLWERVRWLRWLASILGLPLALLGDIYVSLIPSMGEIESRVIKMLYCQTYPYTWRFHQYHQKKLKLNLNDELIKTFQRASKDKAIEVYLDNLLKDSFV